MDLEHFPTKASARRMYSRVSPIYANSYYMKWFYECLGAQWDGVRHYFTTLKDQNFVGSVDWGIEYQEDKYSVEPDRNLTLEQRRARLFIKAYQKYPLNPEVIERQAAERFDFICDIDESEPGYIHVIANYFTEEAWNGFVEYIYSERPAHLALDWHVEWEYSAGGYEDDPYGFERVRGNPIRIGLAEHFSGHGDIYPANPPNDLAKLSGGGAISTGGGIEIGLETTVREEIIERNVGIAELITGEVYVKCDMTDLLTYSNILENAIADILVADTGIARPTEIVLPTGDVIELPEDFPLGEWIRLYFTFPQSAIRVLTLKNPKPDLSKEQIKAVGDEVVQNSMLLGSQGDAAELLKGAALITKRGRTIYET